MENKNPDLEKIVEPENDLKNMLVEYVGNELLNNQGDVTVEMIVEVMAKEFPEFVLALAEENWIRGYQQALEDVDTGLLLNKQEQEVVENVEFKDLFKEQSR
tara:strand:- start:58 stop:363 length:306 start_codon:yes stop_codon:yes gene_type:complete